MKNKELDKVLQNYAESTRNDRDVVFNKLNEMPQHAKCQKKRVKPQFVFATIISVLIIVLSIALPLSLLERSINDEPFYCSSGDLCYDLEESIIFLTNNYSINAKYPTLESESSYVFYVSSRTDTTLHGASIEYIIEETMLFIDIVIIPKTHIVDTYMQYFTLPDTQQWGEYAIRSSKKINGDTEFYDIKIYFTDGKYDYFVSADSEVDIEAIELLDKLYS